jgi:hypothetical protein
MPRGGNGDVLVDAETGRLSPEDPSSERWMQYYREARRRRRALGPRERTRSKLKQVRNRQLVHMSAGFLVAGALAFVFYIVLR